MCEKQAKGEEKLRETKDYLDDIIKSSADAIVVVDMEGIVRSWNKAAEDYIREKIFDKPEEYYNLKKLQKSAQVDRRLTLREILEKIFDLIPYFKSKEELLDEEFNKFVSVYKPEPEYILPIKNFLKAYISDREVQDIVETKQFARFATHPAQEDFRALSPELRNTIPEYVKDYVSLNTYM